MSKKNRTQASGTDRQNVDNISDWVRESGVHQISALGGTVFYSVIALCFLLIGKAEQTAVVFAAYASSLFLAVIVRLVYFKKRPVPREFTTVFGRFWASAFPSLHSMRAFMYAVIFANWLDSTLALAVFLCLAALVAWSRVHLKNHDWVDVGVGAVIGVVLGVGLVWLIPV